MKTMIGITNRAISNHTPTTSYESKPDWLDGAVYPFKSHYLSLDSHRIHYIDEGNGPVLFFYTATSCGRSNTAISSPR